jgi:hypothetical protein
MKQVCVTIPEIGKTRRFQSPDDAHLAATLAKPCYGDPATRTVEITEVDQRPERIAAAWTAADAFAQAGMDSNSRFSLLDLDRDPDCPAWRKARIAAVKAWWKAIWYQYEVAKAIIQAGADATFDPAVPGPCPWTIWQIAAEQP